MLRGIPSVAYLSNCKTKFRSKPEAQLACLLRELKADVDYETCGIAVPMKNRDGNSVLREHYPDFTCRDVEGVGGDGLLFVNYHEVFNQNSTDEEKYIAFTQCSRGICDVCKFCENLFGERWDYAENKAKEKQVSFDELPNTEELKRFKEGKSGYYILNPQNFARDFCECHPKMLVIDKIFGDYRSIDGKEGIYKRFLKMARGARLIRPFSMQLINGAVDFAFLATDGQKMWLVHRGNLAQWKTPKNEELTLQAYKKSYEANGFYIPHVYDENKLMSYFQFSDVDATAYCWGVDGVFFSNLDRYEKHWGRKITGKSAFTTILRIIAEIADTRGEFEESRALKSAADILIKKGWGYEEKVFFTLREDILRKIEQSKNSERS